MIELFFYPRAKATATTRRGPPPPATAPQKKATGSRCANALRGAAVRLDDGEPAAADESKPSAARLRKG